MLFSYESNLFEGCFADLSLRDLFLPHDWLMSNLRADQKRTGALKTPHAKAHHFRPERYLKAPCRRLIIGESRREERNLVKSNERRTAQSGPFSGGYPAVRVYFLPSGVISRFCNVVTLRVLCVGGQKNSRRQDDFR